MNVEVISKCSFCETKVLMLDCVLDFLAGISVVFTLNNTGARTDP